MKRPGDLIVKDPSADEPWGFDWTAFIRELGTGTEISTSTWTVTGPDAILTTHDAGKSTSEEIDGVVTAGHFTKVYLAAGTRGRRYTVTNRIVTNNTPPVTDDRSFTVLIQDK